MRPTKSQIRIHFNSIKVQLEQSNLLYKHIAYYNFNSIKVQLELIYMIGALIGAGLFQFHKGTIRTFVGWLETSAY